MLQGMVHWETGRRGTRYSVWERPPRKEDTVLFLGFMVSLVSSFFQSGLFAELLSFSHRWHHYQFKLSLQNVMMAGQNVMTAG